MGTDGSYIWSEYGIMDNFVKSVWCTPETKCVNYNQKNCKQAIQTRRILNIK